MSLVRKGYEGSDVYIYEDISGGVTCGLCRLSERGAYRATGGATFAEDCQEMFEHMLVHQAHGDIVPGYVMDVLLDPDPEDF